MNPRTFHRRAITEEVKAEMKSEHLEDNALGLKDGREGHLQWAFAEESPFASTHPLLCLDTTQKILEHRKLEGAGGCDSIL